VTGPALAGTWFVLPTPFDQDGAVDLRSQRRLVEATLGWGVDGLTAMGVTSEAAELSSDERSEALKAVADSIGERVPLVVGCSGGDAGSVVDLVREAAAAGALAAMATAPPGIGDIERVPGFFAQVARDGGLPIVIQDEPAATGVRLPVDTLLRSLEASGSRTIKLEDPPTAPKIAALLETHPDLAVFGGLGGAAALWELRHGASGTMTGFAFPEVLRALRKRVEEGHGEEAGLLFDRYLPVIQFEAQPGIGLAVRKELLRRRGAIDTAVTRRGTQLDPVTSRELDDTLRRVGVEPGWEPLEME
jgi:4-hydroxy-tetrahydrodipicolinate synthase